MSIFRRELFFETPCIYSIDWEIWKGKFTCVITWHYLLYFTDMKTFSDRYWIHLSSLVQPTSQTRSAKTSFFFYLYFEKNLLIRISIMKQRKEKRCPLKKDIRNFIDIIPLTFNRVNKLLIDKVSNVHFPDKKYEREL